MCRHAALHTHDLDRWSGVFFVSDGMQQQQQQQHKARHQGRLVFRGGPPRGYGRAAADTSDDDDGCHHDDREDEPASDSDPDGGRGGTDDDDVAMPTSHSFISVPPTAGTLWLFPGSVPHLVTPRLRADSDHKQQAPPVHASAVPRISVAINFREALAPRPI